MGLERPRSKDSGACAAAKIEILAELYPEARGDRPRHPAIAIPIGPGVADSASRPGKLV